MLWDDLELLKYRDPHPPRRVDQVLASFLYHTPALLTPYYEYRLRELWLSDRFQGVGAYTGRITLRGQALSIQIHSDALRANLSLRRDELRDLLNELLGQRVVRELLFV